MSSIQVTNVSRAGGVPVGVPLSGALTGLLATGAGFTVASLYYSQPMLGVMGVELAAGPQTLALVPMLTQAGYALGILLTAPLGDRLDRRWLVLFKCLWLVLALLGAAAAPSMAWLLVASFAIGVAATAAQDIVPAAATLAPEASRGRAVGSVMTGLLLGILLSRVVSGLVADQWGWRATFAVAAGAVALVSVALWRGLPRFQPTTDMGYGALMGSLYRLWTGHRAVRQAALAQGALAIGFSAVWSTLAIWLHGAPFHLGSAAAGAFGLAGAAGALAAPWFGRLADRRGPHHTALMGAWLVGLSFVLLGLGQVLPRENQLLLAVVALIGFDLGFQGALVSHQSIIFSADPAARSRLNALLFVVMFGGMALGSVLAGALFAWAGWLGVVSLATASAGLAVAIRLWPSARGVARGTMRA